jgi:hypothetical protein
LKEEKEEKMEKIEGKLNFKGLSADF